MGVSQKLKEGLVSVRIHFNAKVDNLTIHFNATIQFNGKLENFAIYLNA